MTDDSRIHHRRSIRVKRYDYSSAGAYFVTICAADRRCLFGGIKQAEVHLSPIGQIVTECWSNIPQHFPNAELDVFVLMPNHLHGIIIIPGRGAAYRAPTSAQFGKPVSSSLPTILGSFKAAVTKLARESTSQPDLIVWQRNYFEHIVGNDRALDKIRDDIEANPWNWATDHENPSQTGEDNFRTWLRSQRTVRARHAVPLQHPPP